MKKPAPTVFRKNQKTYKVAATPELLDKITRLALTHTLEMLYVKPTPEGMPSMDAIIQSIAPLKQVLAECASGPNIANRQVLPQNIEGVKVELLVSAGYFVIEFSEVIRDEIKNTLHRYSYRLSVSDESGMPLVMKMTRARMLAGTYDQDTLLRDIGRL